MNKTHRTSKKILLRRRFTIIYLLFFITILVGLKYWEQILSLPGWILVRTDELPPDYPRIILLMGDASGRRARAALHLWQQKPDSEIVYMKEKPEGFVAMGLAKGRDELHTDYFLKAGVPAAKLLHIRDCLTSSTLEEAMCIKTKILPKPPPSSNIVIVTEWYHSSRAGWLFERVFSDTDVKIYMFPAAVDDPSKGVRTWWKDEDMFLRVFEEYLKWANWRVRNLLHKIP